MAPSLSADALKMPAATDVWAVSCSQFWVDFEGARSGSGSSRGRPTPFVDSFPLALWVCQPARHAQHSQRLKDAAATSDPAGPDPARIQRKRLLKEYYSTEAASAAGNTAATSAPGNGLRKPRSLDTLGAGAVSSSSSSSSSTQPDVQVLVAVQKALNAQLNHQQYVFLMRLQRTMKQLQQTLQQDLELIRSGANANAAASPTQPQVQHRPSQIFIHSRYDSCCIVLFFSRSDAFYIVF